MKNTKLSKTRIATIVLAILLVSSTYAVFNVNAQTVADPAAVVAANTALSQRLDPTTGQPYGDPTKYEWVSYGADGENTRYNAGPAPNSANVLWSSNETMATITLGVSGTAAFNGLVFGYETGGLVAFNATDGMRVWGPVSGVTGGLGMFGTAAPVKINEKYMASFSTGNIYFINISNGVRIQTSSISAIAAGYEFTSIGQGVAVAYFQCMYDYASKTLISSAMQTASNLPLGVALDLSDPEAGAKVRWAFQSDTPLEAMCFGDGKAFFGGYGEGVMYAVDLQTGQELWHGFKAGNCGYSATYYNGVLYHAGSSTQITAFDGATGAVVGTFDVAGGRAFYAYGGAAAYGRYFGNSIEIPQGWVSAWDAKTLKQQWKAPAQYYISYMVGCVGDGKFFISATDRNSGPLPGGVGTFNGYHFTAFDAFTGAKVWELPFHLIMPNIAYGHIFGTTSVTGLLGGVLGTGNRIICIGDLPGVSDLPQSSGWPQFHGPSDINGTSTGSVSGNYPMKITSATWKFLADAPISGSPSVNEGKVVFGTWAGTIFCVDAFKGTKLWSNNYGNDVRILSTPTILAGYVYTGADDGNIYALNASTGAQIWKGYAGGIKTVPTLSTQWTPKSSPLVWNGTLYCCANDGNLYAFNATDGTRMWINPASTPANGQGGSLAIHKDLYNRTCIYLLAGGSTLTKVDINGTTVATTSVGTARASMTTPVIVGDLLFITYGSGAGTLGLRNATTLGTIAAGVLFAGSGAGTVMTQTPTYVASNLFKVQNGTYMTVTNAGANVTSGAGMYKLNETRYYTFPAIFLAEATDAGAFALIANRTNLGGSGNANQWILNLTTANMNYELVHIWNAWAGHQVYASATVATLTSGTYAGTNVDYIGNAAYGFTAYNGTDGSVLSTFTAQAQVFSTAALAYNNVYMTANDWYLYAFFGSSASTSTIFANSNKGTQMAVNEATLIEGQLTGYQFFQSEVDRNNNATFYPQLPFQPVNLVWINEDGTSQEVSTTTDINGNFNFTYTPTVSGNAQWLCYFPGATLADGVTLAQAYTTYSKMNVIGQTSPTPTTETATPTGEPFVFTPEIMYAIIGIIVALIVIVAVVMLLRKRKK